MTLPIRVLVVEDEAIIAKDLQNSLRRLGYAVAAVASSGEDALHQARTTQPDIVLMDIRLKGEMDGIETAGHIREHLHLPVIYLTAHADEAMLQRAKVTGPYGYILKPFEERDLHTAIDMALYNHRAEEERTILYQLAHDLARSADINTVAGHLFAQAERLLGGEYMGLMLTNAAGTELTGVAASGMDAEAFRQERVDMGSEFSPGVLAFQQKQPVVVMELAESSQFSERLREKYHFMKSTWIVPLMSGEKAVGIFFVAYTTRRQATAQELRLLQLLGDEAALALERTRLTEELREREERLKAIFETASDAIVALDLQGVIVSVNHATELLFGYRREELVGNLFDPFLTPETASLARERTEKALKGEPLSSIFELEALCKDGARVPMEAKARFLHKQEKPAGLVCIFRDITLRKKLEQQRADFLVMLTHDIKNPLGVILGYAEMLMEEAQARGAEGEKDLLARLRGNTLTVHSLVTNYLDLSKIEAGRLTLAKKSLHLNDLLTRVQQQCQLEAQHRCLSLDVCLQEDLPAVEADALALGRVFFNLVHNAVKFTPAGGRVSISSARRQGEAVVTVADTGPGIAPGELPHVFEKYRRTEQTKHQPGTGLGLFIVKSLVEGHDGRVEVESTLGAGTRFSVFLPVVAAEPTP